MKNLKIKEPYIQPIGPDIAEEDVMRIYDDILSIRDLSFPLKVLAHNPYVLDAKWKFMKSVIYSETLLPKLLKKKMQVVVSDSTGCHK